MTRRVLLVDIGGHAGLPEVTPAPPRTGTWMPALYTPPPPPPPGALQATPAADAVLLTWTASSAADPEYVIDRAPSINGSPGTWVEIGRTRDLRYTATEPGSPPAWYRVHAVSRNRQSAYADEVLAGPSSTELPVVDLEILNGAIVINCAYTDFRLVLTEDVTSVEFVGVPATKTTSIEVEQAAPGSHTIDWPASVVPVTGDAYVPTSTPGAVDLVTLKTINRGITWRLTAVRAGSGDGTAFAVTIAPSPATGSVVAGSTPTAPSVQVAASPAGGAEPVVHKWQRADSGGVAFLVDDDTSPNPTFTIPAGTTPYQATQQWRDTVKDANGQTAQAVVPVTLRRIAELTAPSISAHRMTTPGNPVTVSGSSTAVANFGAPPYTFEWVRTAGTAFVGESGMNTATLTVTLGPATNFLASLEYRVTARDSLGATRTATIFVNLQVEDGR